MKFEDETFEAIMDRMLSGIPGDIDKRETSLAWSMLAPAAMELAQAYVFMSELYNIIFGDTAGELLERRALDFGVEKKGSTKAIREGLFFGENDVPFDIPIGSRFFIDDEYYVARNRISTGRFALENEVPGAKGNDPSGEMLSLSNIAGLERAVLADILIPGTEEQADESLRGALKTRVSKTISSGNPAEYEEWAKEVTGVYGANVYEWWNGPNTVKVVLMDSEGRSPSPHVIQQTWEHIERVRPVGAIVTVVGVTERVIGISATITLQSNTDIETAKASITDNINKYFRGIAGTGDALRFTAIGNALLDGSVVDYSSLTIDGTTSNIILGTDEVPVLGTLTLNLGGLE